MASSLLVRLSVLAVMVSTLFAAQAIWSASATTSVEILGVRPLVADWCAEGKYLEVDVRVRLSRSASNWCGSEEESWLEVERRVAGEWHRREGIWMCVFGGGEQLTLPAGTEVTWTELVHLDPTEDREIRFVLDVPSPKRLGLFGGRLFAASEPFRPSELLARLP